MTNTQNRILAAAGVLLRTTEPEALTVDAVCQQAQVDRATFLASFSAIDQLIGTWIQQLATDSLPAGGLTPAGYAAFLVEMIETDRAGFANVLRFRQRFGHVFQQETRRVFAAMAPADQPLDATRASAGYRELETAVVAALAAPTIDVPAVTKQLTAICAKASQTAATA